MERTGVLLLLITVINAVVGLRQEGKAESAMNALQVVMSLGAAELARRGAVLKDLASVETLGST